MNWQIQNQIKSLNLGDLVRVDWYDASVGKSSFSKGSIDIPSRSWGVYLGVLGEKNKHIILAQNSFKYNDGCYDIDYTAVPLNWPIQIRVLTPAEVTLQEAETLLNSFLTGHRRTLKRRTCNHERLH
jgi:hypothetical protein